MRILQVCSAEAVGGGERHVIDLTRGLAERGHELHLAVRRGSPLPAALADLPVKSHALGLRNAADAASAYRLARLVERHGIDVLHAHVARDYPVCGLAAKLSPVRFFITRHHFHPLKSSALYAWAVSDASALVAVSESVRAELLKAFPKLQDRTVVIPNWVDARRVGSLSRAEAREAFGITRRFAVAVVGQITPLKRQDLFLRAAARLAREDAEFVIVGAALDGQGEAYERRLRESARAAGLNVRVRFAGHVPGVAARLAAFDVVAAPSVNEGFSLALVEAMASGCAVIASRAGGMAEIVEDGVTGLLVPPDDEAALAAALQRLLGDEPLRSRLGQAARASALVRFDREKVIDRIERLYRAGDAAV
jgi:L-malate glycosyltransferase